MIPTLRFEFDFIYWGQDVNGRVANWWITFDPLPDSSKRELLIDAASRVQHVTRARYWTLHVTVWGEKRYGDRNYLGRVRMPLGRDAVARYLHGVFDRLDREAKTATR